MLYSLICTIGEPLPAPMFDVGRLRFGVAKSIVSAPTTQSKMKATMVSQVLSSFELSLAQSEMRLAIRRDYSLAHRDKRELACSRDGVTIICSIGLQRAYR
jgi:hypothetical protein